MVTFKFSAKVDDSGFFTRPEIDLEHCTSHQTKMSMQSAYRKAVKAGAEMPGRLMNVNRLPACVTQLAEGYISRFEIKLGQ